MQPAKSNSAKKPIAARKRGKTTVSNEVKLDAKNPVPFEHNGMALSFVNGMRYLPFLPPNDSFALDLLEARLTSTTHMACVETKTEFCAGNGFHDSAGQELPKEITEWFKSLNKRNESVKKIMKKQFDSHFTWGNTPIELVRFTVAGKKKLFIYVHSFLEWRLCEPEGDDDIATHALQSKLFLRTGYLTADQIKKAKKLPLYNPQNTEKDNWLKDANGVERTLIWYKNDVSGFPNYGLPQAVASMIYQILEFKGARFDLDLFDNDMVMGGIIALKGNMDDREASKIAKSIVRTHTGDGKRGRWSVVASEEGISGSDIHQFDTQKDGSYIQADEKWTQKIILANRWDAVLAGLINASTLGKGAGFITKIIQLKEKTVIKPAQQDLMDEVWTHIFGIAEDWLGLPFSKYNMGFRPFMDISAIGDIDVSPAVTVDEVRVANNLPADTTGKGKMYLGELRGQQQQPKAEGGGDV